MAKSHKYPPGFTRLFHKYKQKAKERGREFAITKDAFYHVTQQKCFYCGTYPKNTIEGFRYNGLDRVLNDVGYNQANVVACCSYCNYSKWTRSTVEFALHITQIVQAAIFEKFQLTVPPELDLHIAAHKWRPTLLDPGEEGDDDAA